MFVRSWCVLCCRISGAIIKSQISLHYLQKRYVNTLQSEKLQIWSKYEMHLITRTREKNYAQVLYQRQVGVSLEEITHFLVYKRWKRMIGSGKGLLFCRICTLKYT